MSERVSPHSIETEQEVLGAMMLRREAISRALAIVTREDFYRGRHREILDAIVKLYEDGEPVDLPILIQVLERRHTLEECGGPGYLAEIGARVGTVANVEYHARQLVELATRRRVIARAGQLQEEAYDTSQPIRETIHRGVSGLLAACDVERKGLEPVGDVGDAVMRELEEIRAGRKAFSGISTGWGGLDHFLGGMKPGEVMALGARPGMGKTAWGLNVAMHNALKGVPVAFFSLEMGADELYGRLLGSHGMVNGLSIRMVRIRDEEWQSLGAAHKELRAIPLYIDESSSLTPMEFRAKVHRAKVIFGVRLVVVDFIQLMAGSSPKMDDTDRASEAMETFREVAKDADVPILTLSQLKQEVDKEKPPRPTLFHFKQTGKIAELAHKAVGLWRPSFYRIEAHPNGSPYELDERGSNVAYFNIVKNRGAPVDEVVLEFVPKYGLFNSLPPQIAARYRHGRSYGQVDEEDAPF